jgi:ubiquitin-like modifier-activating enzyme ATG7
MKNTSSSPSTTNTSPNTLLQFTPFQSAIDASFWHALVDKKLDIIQLSEKAQTLHAYYTTGASSAGTILPPQLCIPGQALEHCVTR